ncbi:hypothetical protein E6O75_ATG06108 [Venturia nashicola]|uniref:Uncharacterized protein n=1 Tax=Venturia nashicola TaxID=86259 RepID=A0A4Z1NWI8_9PEZI|nr:hypothetical protein E6O75_ATG06108 [Venturia nashicola]
MGWVRLGARDVLSALGADLSVDTGAFINQQTPALQVTSLSLSRSLSHCLNPIFPFQGLHWALMPTHSLIAFINIYQASQLLKEMGLQQLYFCAESRQGVFFFVAYPPYHEESDSIPVQDLTRQSQSGQSKIKIAYMFAPIRPHHTSLVYQKGISRHSTQELEVEVESS